MALAGLRATAFLGGDDFLSAHEPLHTAANRFTPLVLHAECGEAGHAAYHAVAEAGLFQILPSSGQSAVDLSLVARWLTERALVPGLVATDGCTIERLELPSDETLRSYLGRPDDPISTPTEAQRLLFGTERPRLLSWFDPDRPVATGEIRGVHEQERARLGGRLFFWDHVTELAREGMEELSRRTGRPLSFVERYGLEDADLVLVAQGAVVQTARAVAETLRRTRRYRVGVLGVTWLRPLPVTELREALGGRKAVAVVEASGPPTADPPLFRELEAAVGESGWISATCAGSGPDPDRLAGLCELLQKRDRPDRVHLDPVTVAGSTGFPRRDALLQSLANGYPRLREAALSGDSLAFDPEGGRSVGVVGPESLLPVDAPALVADALAAEVGPFVRGTVTRPEPGTIEVRVRAAHEDFPDAGSRSPVSLLLLALSTGNARDLGRPFEAVHPKGTVIVSTPEPPDRVGSILPAGWRKVAADRELRVLVAPAPFEEALEAVRACLRGEEAPLLDDGRLRALGQERAVEGIPDRGLPAVVRRIGHMRAAHDSLPRFWGEVAQPRQGGATDEVPDPLTATGVVPAGASALESDAAPQMLPVLDAESCTGCGRCWSACPDGAIGVTALGIEPLFEAASRIADTKGKTADALRRAHKHLAGRLASQIAEREAQQLTPEACRDGFTWLAKRMDLKEEVLPEYRAAFDSTLDAATRLPLVVARPFFEEPEQQKKGAGELLVLAIDPRACLGCGLCVSVCPEDALASTERSVGKVAELEASWQTWEQLPDTAGATLQRAAENPDVGPLPALLLSRHCAQAQVGGAGGEPGSGERLAARLVAAVVEHHAQRRAAGVVRALDEKVQALEEKVRERLSEGFSSTDSDVLAEALGGVTRGRVSVSDLGRRLDELGSPVTFDRSPVLHMSRTIGELNANRDRLAEGQDGLGRARFGVVVAEGSAAEWAARFPRHPYYAPLTVAPIAEGIELTRGIAHGLAAEHLERVRLLREADVEAESPPDRAARLETIRALRWEDLDAQDRAACPPLLLMGDETALLERGFDALTRLLASPLPVKVVLLDGRGSLGSEVEPALVAMAHRRAFVLAGSIAHTDHLARGLEQALGWPGPALLHVHAPSPLRHGFAPDATLERARLAVEGRAHILFRYSPMEEGLFGLRATLEGNPGVDEDWGGTTFAEWAAGESRFADHFEPDEAEGVPLNEWLSLDEAARRGRAPCIEVDGRRLAVDRGMADACAERLVVWNTLRELTGAAGPFTERVRGVLEKEIEAEHEQQLAALKAEYEARIAELRAGADQQAVARLKDRLLALTGYSKPRPKGNGA
jgi:pyruvate-ferredoxin/flavodoxin oxidoreductase